MIPGKNVSLTFNKPELEIIRNQLCSDATPKEFEWYIYNCRVRGLNPLLGQIYCVIYKNSDGTRQVSMQTGIDGYRKKALESGEYMGQVGPYWCDKDGVWRDIWNGDQVPYAAKVGVWRRGFIEPVWGVAKYGEYVQRGKNGQPKRIWASMPATMLAKCAEAQALRKAFPDELSGLYTQEEMGRAGRIDDETKGDSAALARDRAMVYILAKKAMPNSSDAKVKETVKERLAEKYGVRSTKELSPQQLFETLDYLRAAAAKPARVVNAIKGSKPEKKEDPKAKAEATATQDKSIAEAEVVDEAEAEAFEN